MLPASFGWQGSLRRPAGWCVAGPGIMTRTTRASYRNNNAPDNRVNHVGLRVVRSSHILIPLMAQPGGCLRIRLLRACSPASLARAVLPVLAADYGWRPEAKVIKMAQVSPARTGFAR